MIVSDRMQAILNRVADLVLGVAKAEWDDALNKGRQVIEPKLRSKREADRRGLLNSCFTSKISFSLHNALTPAKNVFHFPAFLPVFSFPSRLSMSKAMFRHSSITARISLLLWSSPAAWVAARRPKKAQYLAKSREAVSRPDANALVRVSVSSLCLLAPEPEW